MSDAMDYSSPFQQLQVILNSFGPEASDNKLKLLKACSLQKLVNSKTILQYHQQLLFLLSYAESVEIHSLAKSEMERLTRTISKNETISEKLIGSGIAETVMQGAYSLTLTKWLIDTFPNAVSLHSFDESGIHPKEILKHILPDVEFELTSDELLKPIKWLEKAAGTKNRKQLLNWLVESINVVNATDSIKDQIFESLNLFVEIEPKENSFSKSFGKVSVSKQYFHSDGIIKKFNELELINKKLPNEKRLSKKEKQEIISCSRVVLCLLIRETDPITYCEELNVKYYELERGLSIALFSIDAERRLPIESYIGFMMFKNGYPMSYGGAWLFGKRSLIGINIFEAFRGGESAIVFAQLLRCYKMAFGATYFEVEPYQFGKGNPEGIQSGAFWFYHRFGFRPLDTKLFKLAEEEHSKIISQKGYRSPVSVLKQFTQSNLFVDFKSGSKKPLNPSDISRFITAEINNSFAGNRKKAVSFSIKKLKEQKIITTGTPVNSINKLAIFVALCLNVEKLKTSERQTLQKILVSKTNNEFEYTKLCTAFGFENKLAGKMQEYLAKKTIRTEL